MCGLYTERWSYAIGWSLVTTNSVDHIRSSTDTHYSIDSEDDYPRPDDHLRALIQNQPLLKTIFRNPPIIAYKA